MLLAGGVRLQLGASWIHGILGNPVYELAYSHGLVNIVQENKPHNVIALLPDGTRVPFALIQVRGLMGIVPGYTPSG